MPNTRFLKALILLLTTVLISFSVDAQVKIMTWNLLNVGKSKTDENIEYIAKVIKQTDIIAIQEVVTNPSGAQTIAKIHEELNRSSGAKWDYAISDPTVSSPYRSERYAYLWKTSKVKLKGKPFLEPTYVEEIEREPYMATFIYKGKELTISSIHTLPTKHQPETEIKYLKFFPEAYPEHNLIFLGDFNLTEQHSVFNPLKKLGYVPSFTEQKSSLKQKCIKGDCLASEYDNIFYHTDKNELVKAKPILFYEDFEDITIARRISDHIPLMITINPL
ncbi:endonuclease/exonuclease/phosphatase family protein [Myroides marinus]|uniref:endonuclease/exonuclease/phosphatase family protein n=1 Tax=Myroides marinus TaxID=703342 RepID=UPI002577612D|nr:endonuclease/exonuclease/phosphatase family protein [Myroides marinus]MDM1347125.1 endonuclease/exonuclease/phosphatase family protein [Myroides marinus]MDM1350644.1 endonuclease/exonuclease/phosphatase family protein [Myroides marinus]MDM1354364.1 endonuclease/exonuclease/phosphatase family protein [Myroides marinus]MDM1357851.1 endonuclease/exonuclease/phosphatase family protein [Myroides marinus]MDM1365215.1 endonuclease/exonuclease/phosphatase family protein [Myroides marinus]